MAVSYKSIVMRALGSVMFAVLGTGAFADSPQLSMGGYARSLQKLQTMAMMDADRDHFVTRAEFMKFHEEMFDRMDANHDGRIDKTEWQQRLGGIGGKGSN
jgi:hypothetical protein